VGGGRGGEGGGGEASAAHPLADEDVVARELALLAGVSLDVLYQVIP
jgi:hypothetical protein